MVRDDAVKIASEYISSLSGHGLVISKAILFGSYARNDFNKDSDIDILIVSPDFDKDDDTYYALLWKLTKIGNYKIEPVPVGENSFINSSASPIIEIAKSEGIELKIA